MKKNYIYLLILMCSIVFFSCEYDDSYLKDEIDKIKTDVSALKEQTNALKTVVDALNAGKVITKTEALANNRGYKITFNDGKSIEILNGAKAAEIGIEEHEGVYYWTLTTEGKTEYLVDKNGNKLQVAGKDGTTPELGIDAEGFWTINNVRVKNANGKEVKAQGDSFFKEVKEKDDTVIFTLAGGKTLELPKSKGTHLMFDNNGNDPFYIFKAGEKKQLKIKYANIKSIEVVSKPNGWKVNLHQPGKYVEVVAPAESNHEIQEIILRGLDSNGMMFMAIAKVNIPGKIFSDPLGVFILNEGNMTTENGSLIFIDGKRSIFNKAYYNINGKEMGNQTQDLFIKDNKMFIIAQNGRKNAMGDGFENEGTLLIADAETLTKIANYNEEVALSWPTHIAVLNDENIFIRDNNGIHVFNATTKKLALVEGTRGAAKNRMAVADDKVFVIAGKKILALTANSLKVEQSAEMTANISGILRAKDGNLWVSTTGTPNKISKIDSKTLAVIKTNDITEGKVGAGFGATPGITAKGDTLYYSNAGTTIYRHIFSNGESMKMIDAKTVVSNAGMVYNNIAVHPLTGEVYMTTIKGYGFDYLINNISVFEDANNEMTLKQNHTNYTKFPAGVFFNASFK